MIAETRRYSGTTKPTRISQGIKAAVHVLLATHLCACLPERFRHEKYDCSASLNDIQNIILNKDKPGEYAKINTYGSQKTATIIKIDDETASVTDENILMTIDRKTGTITVIRGNRYKKAICKKTVFTM